MQYLGAVLCLLFFPLSILFSQELDISGMVVSESTGEPLIGAHLVVKGTHVGTVTNLEGEFRLTVQDLSEATLVVSFIGYRTREIVVRESRTDMQIALAEDVLRISEVVVTGLASTVARQNLAHAVATIPAADLVPVPTQSLERALSGKFAGITVSQNTGAPGGGIHVNLRGISTIEGETQPLYVVDGVIINNAAIQSGIDLVTRATGAGSPRPQGQPTTRVADINPNEIESIEVLKGASAAAIYGSKATNGVIIITTRQGAPGRTRIDVHQQIGFNTLLRKVGTRRFTAETAEIHYGELGRSIYEASGGRFVDYEDVLYGETGVINETVVNVTGGTIDTRIFASGTYREEGGIVKNTGYSRYTGRVNLHHRLHSRVRTNLFVNLIRTESDRGITGNDNSNTTFGFSLGFTPSFLDIRPNNGNYPDHPFNPSNPLHTRDLLTNNETVYRTVGAAQVQWNLYQTNQQLLDVIVHSGVDYFTQDNKVISPPELQYERESDLPGASLKGETQSVNATLYLNLSHNYITSSNIILNTTTGLQIETLDQNNTLIEARGLIVTQTNVDQAASLNAYQRVIKQRDLGFYFQSELNFRNIYYLTLGIRSDASSTIGDPDKFFYYPKASLSMRLSQLSMWESFRSLASEFKLRIAYGETGNLPPPDGKFTSLVPHNIDGGVGLLPDARRGAPDIKPERTKELEFGFDAVLFGERATFEATYFNQSISELILIASLPPSSGFREELINGGEMNTRGIELSLGLNPIRSRSVNWRSRINFYKTESKITRLDVSAFNKGGFATFLGTYRIQEGWSPTTIIGADVDAGGNHIKLGNETPDFQMSFNNTFAVGNFELGFLFDWKQGGDVINLGKLITDLGATTFDYDEIGTFMIDGTPTQMKKGEGRLAILGTSTAQYVEDGTYLKLREARLTYTFPRSTVERWFGTALSSMQLGIGGRNLLMFTSYTGYDPEVSQFGNVAIGRSVDTIPYPSYRSFYMNISLGF
jgi:TonB-dependent starch-binding outer membrane protein SusC